MRKRELGNSSKGSADGSDMPIVGTYWRASCESRAKAAFAIGDREILHRPLLGLFCSERCPGDLIIKAFDATTALRDSSVPVISGFHSRVERECLRILLRGMQPVVVSPARSLERMRLPAEWRGPICEGRLLLISPFTANQSRITAALAAQRNEFVVALARAALVVYADPGGKIETLARRILQEGKSLFALDHPSNENLLATGARAVGVSEIASVWKATLA